MGIFNICRMEDFHLWYDVAKHVFFVAGVMLAFLVIVAGYMRYYKKMAEDIIDTIKFRSNTEGEGGDNWPSLQLEMFNFNSSDDLTYADFERCCMQIESKEKKFFEQK